MRNDEPICDLCNENPAELIAFDPSRPAKVYDTSIGIGRVVLFLCKVCIGGTIGAMLLSAGMRILEVMR